MKLLSGDVKQAMKSGFQERSKEEKGIWTPSAFRQNLRPRDWMKTPRGETPMRGPQLGLETCQLLETGGTGQDRDTPQRRLQRNSH